MMLLEPEERLRKGHQAAAPRHMIKSWEWEGAVARTEWMRGRTRGCHKRGQNLGRERWEGTMLAGAGQPWVRAPGGKPGVRVGCMPSVPLTHLSVRRH